jgi:hypothetical protein
MTEPERPAPTYATRPAFSPSQGQKSTGDVRTGTTQILILSVLGAFLIFIGSGMALMANGL